MTVADLLAIDSAMKQAQAPQAKPTTKNVALTFHIGTPELSLYQRA